MLKLNRRDTLAGMLGTAMAGMAGQAGAQTPEKSDADVVRVGVVKVAGVSAIHAAQSLGYFKDEGLNVQPVVVRSGTEAQAAVVAGALEFVPLNASSFIYALHEDFKFKAVADAFRAPLNPPGSLGIVVRRDGPISKPKDLEGRTLGLIGRKTLVELYLVMWAEKNGVDLKKVQMIEMPYTQMVDVVAAGQVDATIPLEPFITKGLTDGKVKVLSFYDIEVDPGHASGLWSGTASWVDAHPIAAKKFRSAVYRAHTAMNNDPALATRMISEWTDFPPELVGKMGRDIFATDLPIAFMERIADTMRKMGWITKPIDIRAAML